MRKVNIGNEKEKTKLGLDLKKNLTSNNINVLFGAGFSAEVLGVLSDFEENLTKALANGDTEKESQIYKEFFGKCILPLNDEVKLYCGETARLKMINSLAGIINSRHSSSSLSTGTPISIFSTSNPLGKQKLRILVFLISNCVNASIRASIIIPTPLSPNKENSWVGLEEGAEEMKQLMIKIIKNLGYKKIGKRDGNIYAKNHYWEI